MVEELLLKAAAWFTSLSIADITKVALCVLIIRLLTGVVVRVKGLAPEGWRAKGKGRVILPSITPFIRLHLVLTLISWGVFLPGLFYAIKNCEEGSGWWLIVVLMGFWAIGNIIVFIGWLYDRAIGGIELY